MITLEVDLKSHGRGSGVNTRKTLTYEITGERWLSFDGVECGFPSAKVTIEFPPAVERMDAFRASLEEVFAEIFRACES